MGDPIKASLIDLTAEQEEEDDEEEENSPVTVMRSRRSKKKKNQPNLKRRGNPNVILSSDEEDGETRPNDVSFTPENNSDDEVIGGDDDNNNDNDEEGILLGRLDMNMCRYCKIVGIRYYSGQVHEGEMVRLVREPNNLYDRNAIKVVNWTAGVQIGHLAKECAAVIAPLLDRYQTQPTSARATASSSSSSPSSADNEVLFWIDASVPGPGSSWHWPLSLEFRTKDPTVLTPEHLEEALQPLWIYEARRPASLMQSSTERQRVTVHKTILDWKKTAREDKLRLLFASAESAATKLLATVSAPPGLLSTLLPHQQYGLNWMVHQERLRPVTAGSISSPPAATRKNSAAPSRQPTAAASKKDRPTKASPTTEDSDTALICNSTPNVPVFYRPIQERGQIVWYNELTHTTQIDPPHFIQGGILADDMGLGKTLQTLALMLAQPPKGRDYLFSGLSSLLTNKDAEDQNDENDQKLPARSDKVALTRADSETDRGTIRRTTLIVCPVSVMSNWLDQIQTHIYPSIWRVELYQGTQRDQLLQHMNKIDVLIVSYNTLQYDYTKFSPKEKKSSWVPPAKKAKSSSKSSGSKAGCSDSLFDMEFHRVVLDEAHFVRNSKSQTFAACAALQTDRRWCLTGTPLTNTPNDLQSLFQFLNVPPLADAQVFRRAIGQPIKDGDELGLARLRTMMAHVALRRCKSQLDIALPKKTVELRSVEFSEGNPHGDIYQTLFQSAKALLSATLTADGELIPSRQSAVMFEILTRLRQACCSGNLVPVDRLQRAEQIMARLKKENSPLTAEEAQSLLEKLKSALSGGEEGDDTLPECSICMEQMSENVAVVLRRCGHVFCSPCLSKVEGMAHRYDSSLGHPCPFCRTTFDHADIVPWSAALSASRQHDSAGAATTTLSQRLEEGLSCPSPKLEALLMALQEMQDHEKAVIFSQFTQFLDEIQRF